MSAPPSADPPTDDAYHVVLENFQGPLDLLLHLIKEQEMNIYDIPIAVITQQYLHYLDLMKALNINIAGEFLVMAATLVHIKSRMLLPPEETHADGLEEEDGVDPREELVQRLLEYQRYKSAAAGLEGRAEEWREFFARPAVESPAEEEGLLLNDLQLFDLVAALQRVVQRLPPTTPFVITSDELSVTERMAVILEELAAYSTVSFEQLCAGARSKLFVVVTFLAVLELVRLQLMMASVNEQHELILSRSMASAFKGDVDPGLAEEGT